MRIYLGAQKKYAYAVSVIIPMFNAEDFIGECLDSLLIQTFQDFEVIVVDDCSTDNSVAIVQSYAEKFGGRLKLTKTEKNSGGCSVPKNIGINLAGGKYIQCLDADDFLLGSALEILYNAAEEFDSDVTHIAAHYRLYRPNEVTVWAKKNLEDKPIFLADDTNKIVQEYLSHEWFHHHAPWLVFVKRDFLIENRILFPEKVCIGGDGIWNLHIRCFSKRFLIISNPVYFWRCYNTESVTKKRRPPAEQISHRGRAFKLWLNALHELSNRLDYLKKNPACLYNIFKMEVEGILKKLREYRPELSDREIYEILQRDFTAENDSSAWMMPFFFACINAERKLNDKRFSIHRYLTARVDIKLIPQGAGDFQIVSISDDKASVEQPSWFNKDGIGYIIQSYAGKLEIAAKATADGQLRFILKGISVYSQENQSKRIPFWTYYTKFLVNEQIIFDTLTPAWHDKLYAYNMNVNAGEEIKIHIEWLTPDLSQKIVKVSDNPIVAVPCNFPAVSVIISLYNYEKYVGECLESLLAQTLKNFEVIVVDDCSTDNSVAVVESYLEKFGGRLRLVHTKKNSGSASLSRNIGLKFSRGEYIYFLDADDAVTPTALEDMYTLAKKYAADVVYCEKYFMSKGIGQDFEDNVYFAEGKIQKPPFVNKPKLETENFSERLDKWLNANYWPSVSLRLIKRDLLIENDITFPQLVGSEDDIWSLKVLFSSKRFLRIPNICFVRRMHFGGISFGEYTTSKYVQRWMDLVIRALKDLDNFLGEIEFFKENPDSRYTIIKHFINQRVLTVYRKAGDTDSFELYNIFLEMFGKHLGEQDVLVSCLLSCINENNRLEDKE